MKIEKQLDFYFSNQNYLQDTFLRNTCEEENGIAIKTILTFKRLADLKVTEEEIKEAVKNTKNVKLEGDDKLVKVKDESYENYINQKREDYMIVVDGFDNNFTLDQIEVFLNKHMKPTLIRMKRKNKKEFTGAVLVELNTLEEVKEALKLELDAPTDSEKEEIDNENKKQEGKDEPEENSTKKVKLNKLDIKTKADYQKNLQVKNQNKDKKDNFIKMNKNKVFKFETSKEMEIGDVRKKIKNVAFVDLTNKILRFKYPQEQTEITVDDDFKLTLLSDNEYKEYVENVVYKKINNK